MDQAFAVAGCGGSHHDETTPADDRAAARLGRDLEIRTVPFAEILPSVKNGTVVTTQLVVD